MPYQLTSPHIQAPLSLSAHPWKLTEGYWYTYKPSAESCASHAGGLSQKRSIAGALMEIEALNHVGVRCTRVEAMEAFYLGTLGAYSAS